MPPTYVHTPVYESIVSINEDFVNSTSVTFHYIHENNSSYFFDYIGRPVFDDYARYIVTHNSTIVHNKVYRGQGFKLDNKSIRSKTKQFLVKSKTSTVEYQPNKARDAWFVKTCIPKESSIVIHDINKILLPRYRLKFNILRNQYSCVLLETRNKLNITDSDLFNCKICRGMIDDTAKGHETVALPLLCNSCGVIAHNPSEKTNCSHLCEICGKTICKNCAWYTRKYLFMKKILCEPCAEQNPKKKSKLN